MRKLKKKLDRIYRINRMEKEIQASFTRLVFLILLIPLILSKILPPFDSLDVRKKVAALSIGLP